MNFTLPQAGAVRFTGTNNGLDPRLFGLLSEGSRYLPDGYSVQFKSGLREGDPRNHGKGMAGDVQIIDPSGKPLANYQDPSTFRTYEQYAQSVRALQQQQHPDMPLRWGGYFSGPPGKYGALDVMHFDTATTPIGGGSWDTGLHPQQMALWPGVESVGMGNAAPSLAPATNVASVPGTAAPAAAVASTGGDDFMSKLAALDVPGALSEIFSPTKSSKEPSLDLSKLLGGGSKGALSDVMAEDDAAARRGEPTGEDITRNAIASNIAALRATGGPQKAALSDQMAAQDEQRRMGRLNLGTPMQKGSPLRSAMMMAQMNNMKF